MSHEKTMRVSESEFREFLFREYTALIRQPSEAFGKLFFGEDPQPYISGYGVSRGPDGMYHLKVKYHE